MDSVPLAMELNFDVSYLYVPHTPVSLNAGVEAPSGIAIGRLRDSVPLQDVVVADEGQGAILVFANQGGTGENWLGFAEPVPYAIGGAPSGVALADLNGDGRLDIACSRIGGEGGPDAMVYLINDGAGQFTVFAPPVLNLPAVPRGVSASDLDNDKWDDLVTTLRMQNAIAVFRDDSGDGFQHAEFYNVGGDGGGFGPVALASDDLNADGRTDIVTANADDDTVSVLLNISAGEGAGSEALFGQARIFRIAPDVEPGQLGVESVTLTDLNSDGMPDVLVASSQQAVVSVLLNRGSDTDGTWLGLEATQRVPVSSGLRSVVAAQFVDDAPVDVVAGAVAGRVGTYLTNDGTGTIGAPVEYQTEQTVPLYLAVGDVDSDGYLDVVCVGPGAVEAALGTESLRGPAAANLEGLINVMAPPPLPPPCAGDANQDGSVNGADLSVLLFLFGQVIDPPGRAADFNSDGAVDADDLAILLNEWGSTCAPR